MSFICAMRYSAAYVSAVCSETDITSKLIHRDQFGLRFEKPARPNAT